MLLSHSSPTTASVEKTLPSGSSRASCFPAVVVFKQRGQKKSKPKKQTRNQRFPSPTKVLTGALAVSDPGCLLKVSRLFLLYSLDTGEDGPCPVPSQRPFPTPPDREAEKFPRRSPNFLPRPGAAFEGSGQGARRGARGVGARCGRARGRHRGCSAALGLGVLQALGLAARTKVAAQCLGPERPQRSAALSSAGRGRANRDLEPRVPRLCAIRLRREGGSWRYRASRPRQPGPSYWRGGHTRARRLRSQRAPGTEPPGPVGGGGAQRGTSG